MKRILICISILHIVLLVPFLFAKNTDFSVPEVLLMFSFFYYMISNFVLLLIVLLQIIIMVKAIKSGVFSVKVLPLYIINLVVCIYMSYVGFTMFSTIVF